MGLFRSRRPSDPLPTSSKAPVAVRARGFDGLVGALASPVMSVVNRDMERAAVSMVEPRNGERFLVLGFGSGVGIATLLDVAVPDLVVGVDPSKAMVRATSRRMARYRGAAPIRLLTCTTADIPPDPVFDAAIAVNVEQFWEPYPDSLTSVAAALRPGGRLITLTHQWAITRRASLAEWKAMIETGLTIAEMDRPAWTESRFRSGPALGYRSCKQRSPADPGLPGDTTGPA